MKIKVFICRSVFIVILIILLSGYGFGGGPGGEYVVIANPYSDDDGLTIDKVQEVKIQSSRNRCIESGAFPMKDDIVRRCYSVGLRFEKNNENFYYIEGQDVDSYAQHKIYFSQIESIELIEEKDPVAVVKIVIFPYISVSELVNRKHSYVDLSNNFRKIVKIRLNAYDYSYGYLNLVCVEDDYHYTVISRIIDFPKNVKVSFSYDIRKDSPVWWATEEVIQDKDYPYRKTIYTAPTTGIE